MFYEQKTYSEMSKNFDDDLSEVEMRLMARRPSIEGNQFVCAVTSGSTTLRALSSSSGRLLPGNFR